MKLLLTGATGFVGRNFIVRTHGQWEAIYAPVRDSEKLRSQLQSEGLDEVPIQPLPVDPAHWKDITPTHALLSAGVLFASSRDDYFTTNVDWNLGILRALPADCRTVILSSQSAGGPTPKEKAARVESDKDTPITWYGESKLAFERAALKEFPRRTIGILRPPMVLGARDTATLPLFLMADNLIRIKPGLRPKTYSFIAVDDLVNAILALLLSTDFLSKTFYAASSISITDLELIAAAAALRANANRGAIVPVPELLLRPLSMLVEAVPALRTKAPSLTRDRVREISPERWVIDSSAFCSATSWQARTTLAEALRGAHDFYVGAGLLKPIKKA